MAYPVNYISGKITIKWACGRKKNAVIDKRIKNFQYWSLSKLDLSGIPDLHLISQKKSWKVTLKDISKLNTYKTISMLRQVCRLHVR